jgi:hypothetical protein
VQRKNRALALAATAGLLLLAPATMASATSPFQFQAAVRPEVVEIPSWTLTFRETKASQMTLVDALDVSRHVSEPLGAQDRATQAIDSGSRYDGKQIPI